MNKLLNRVNIELKLWNSFSILSSKRRKFQISISFIQVAKLWSSIQNIILCECVLTWPSAFIQDHIRHITCVNNTSEVCSLCVSVCIGPSADAKGCFSPWNCNIILTVSFSGREVCNSWSGQQSHPNLPVKAERGSKRKFRDRYSTLQAHPSSFGNQSEWLKIGEHPLLYF